MKNNVKKIIVCLIAITMVILIATKTLATDNNDKVNQMLENMRNSNQGSTINENDESEDIKNGIRNKNTNNDNANNKDTLNINGNNNENKPTTNPYAGAGDYSTIIFIAIFAVSAVYAYKKIKDYNM